jgi:hypothetical protein
MGGENRTSLRIYAKSQSTIYHLPSGPPVDGSSTHEGILSDPPTHCAIVLFRRSPVNEESVIAINASVTITDLPRDRGGVQPTHSIKHVWMIDLSILSVGNMATPMVWAQRNMTVDRGVRIDGPPFTAHEEGTIRVHAPDHPIDIIINNHVIASVPPTPLCFGRGLYIFNIPWCGRTIPLFIGDAVNLYYRVIIHVRVYKIMTSLVLRRWREFLVGGSKFIRFWDKRQFLA